MIHDPIDFRVDQNSSLQILDQILIKFQHKYWFNDEKYFSFIDEEDGSPIKPAADRFLQAGHTYSVIVAYK